MNLIQLSDRINPWALYQYATRTKDCNVVKTVEGVRRSKRLRITVRQARAAASDPDGPTGNAFSTRVFRHYGLRYVADPFQPASGPRYTTLSGHPVERARRLLAEGWFVTLYIDYDILNRKYPRFSGDPNFVTRVDYSGRVIRAFHAVGLRTFRLVNGKRRVYSFDPLHDGRRLSIPKGRQDAPFAVYRDAAAGYAGAGRVSGWATHR